MKYYRRRRAGRYRYRKRPYYRKRSYRIRRSRSYRRAANRGATWHWADTYTNLTVGVDTGGVIYMLAPSAGEPIPKGTNVNERISDFIRPVKMRIRYSWVAQDAYNRCRVIIFRLKDGRRIGGDSYSPSWASYIPELGYQVTVDNMPNTDRITVLYDKTDILTSPSPGEFVSYPMAGRQHTVILPYSKLRPLHWMGSETTPMDGVTYMYVCTDSGAVAHPTFRMSCKVHFKP